ncbi:hypothetical protein MMC13_003574 [Lambiella insularis]|nr:hypothetical protein [Lambiella insularis]
MAAVAATIKGFDEASFEALTAENGLSLARPGSSKHADAGHAVLGKSSRYTTVDHHGSEDRSMQDQAMEDDSAIAYGDAVLHSHNDTSKSRARRASEGAYLTKTDGKRASGELKCENWEHTPEWSYTSKLLISKHQQVQLLEAASVLVTMNQDVVPLSEFLKASDSENSSASPVLFTSSDADDDDVSSVETTPPPIGEQVDFTAYDGARNEKRYSSNSSVFSRSYQSAPSASIAASSVPTAASYGSFHHLAYQRRPSTTGNTSLVYGAAEDETALAAAVELCNFNGTPRTGPLQMDDVPPVPPLPARYASHNAIRPVSGIGYPSIQDLGLPPPLTHRLSDERGSKMPDRVPRVTNEDEEDYDQRSIFHGRSDDDDDGVFGLMEE